MSSEERARLLGERIVSARKRKGMSQVQLASILAERYGTDTETIRRSLGNNERGVYAPRLHRLQAIADATDQPLEFFSVGEGNGDGDPPPFRDGHGA